MKRICFLVDSVFTYGGVQRVTAVIAKQLARHYNVTITTFDPPSLQDVSLYGLDEAPDLAFRFFSYPATGRVHRLLCKAYSALYRKLQPRWQWASRLYALSSFPSPLRRALTDELRQGHYDCIVGVHAPLAVRLATLMPRLPGVRCLGWVHNSFEALFSPASPYIGPDLQHHYVCQLRRLHSCIVLCEHDAAVYRAYDPRFRPEVIYNPLTLAPGAPSAATSRRFLAVGRFTPLHKGFDLLIDAFSLFAANEADWCLDIVGEGPEEQRYREKIAACGLQGRIAIHPFTNHIQHYYSNAQVFVLSSRWEGFGLVLVEAMAHGLPVVSSDLPTSLEIMGPFALYFRNGSVEELAQRLADSTKLDFQFKRQEALAIARRFAVDRIARQWQRVIG